ncbi:hypothetical protein JHW43_006901 [Diplocarpon mali]|nr:hypothetical protein JHW43_006901 [Diplocarpon mali]
MNVAVAQSTRQYHDNTSQSPNPCPYLSRASSNAHLQFDLNNLDLEDTPASQAGMMNGRHLPAGQSMPIDVGRRRPHNQYQQQHQHQHQHQHQQYAPQMYNNYMQPYASNYYPQPIPPQYHNAPLPHQYNPYPPPPYVRSPPPIQQHYGPAPLPQQQQQQQPYTKPQQPLVVSSPYHAPASAPPPRAPSSTQSTHAVPAPMTPPTPKTTLSATPSPPAQESSIRSSFRAPLPWLSRPDLQWPVRKARRKRKAVPKSSGTTISSGDIESELKDVGKNAQANSVEEKGIVQEPVAEDVAAGDENSEEAVMHRPETPSTGHPTSDDNSTNPTTPCSQQPPAFVAGETTPLAPRAAQRSVGPVVPVLPKVIKSLPDKTDEPQRRVPEVDADATSEVQSLVGDKEEAKEASPVAPAPKAWATPKSWTGLFTTAAAASNEASNESGLPVSTPIAAKNNAQSLADALLSFNAVSNASKVAFLKPRGLVNTGNMCYMNSRGHQQDAEEFLGFLLEGLHDECVLAMHNSTLNNTSAIATPTNGQSPPLSEAGGVAAFDSAAKENGWLEVGPKQKAAVTRSSGTIVTGSPVTKIFGGNLRSELRVPGLKDSVTLEPYQPLQLDIGASNVNNIIDALKGLTRSEALHGDFKSPKGPNVTATKQVFIETLPPVLILHLKRFQYDNTGGTQKIWKRVGYPLELEIPKEVFPRQKRATYVHSGLPKYRLIGVVYHHGKNATGGHYTVDVRRQDGREWVRLDDTVICRVRSEEVAEGGSEEDPRVLATALDGQKKDSISSNGFAAIDGAEEDADQDGWKQASGTGKKWSAVANGASAPKGNSDRFSIKDNKVAYLLFYQKI